MISKCSILSDDGASPGGEGGYFVVIFEEKR